MIAKTDGTVLKTLFDGITMENEDDDENVDLENETTPEHSAGVPDFRPIWSLDIYDRYVLAGCGGDDGRLEVWDAYTGQLVSVYLSDHLRNGFDGSFATQATSSSAASLAITSLKATYWGVALARINGWLELLDLTGTGEDRYSTFCSPNTTATPSSSRIGYRLRCRLQAHQQPVSRLEVIDSLEDEDFIKIFGSRGCLISGSLDHTLKVYSLDQGKLIYTLNGHCGSIMTTFVDPV